MVLVKNAEKSQRRCHDCQKKIELAEKEIKNGFLLEYNDGGEKLMVFKCKDCFNESQALANFRKCEVYSRIVGYLRPVQQWNTGKRKEFEERKEYRLQTKNL